MRLNGGWLLLVLLLLLILSDVELIRNRLFRLRARKTVITLTRSLCLLLLLAKMFRLAVNRLLAPSTSTLMFPVRNRGTRVQLNA